MIKFIANYIFTFIEIFVLINVYQFFVHFKMYHHHIICWLILPLVFITFRFIVGSSGFMLILKIGNKELWEDYIKRIKR